MSSFIDHGFGYKLYSYIEYHVPRGVSLCDASSILPETEVFFYKFPDGSNRSVAGFANLFRYVLLASQGGWWVDTDVICLSAEIPDEELFFALEHNDRLGNAILKAPIGHELMGKAAERAREAGKDLQWGQTGPLLLTELAHDMGLFGRASPADFAYPVHYSHYGHITRAAHFREVVAKVRQSAFLHLWHEMFRIHADDSIYSPEPGSFLASKFKQHMTSSR